MRTIATMTDAERAEEWLRAAQHELGRGNLGPALRALASADMLDALELHVAYEAVPQDRGGKNGPKGKARAAWIAARDAALARAKGEG